jgi:hypothetical protein
MFMKKLIFAATICGIAGFGSPSFAQDPVVSAPAPGATSQRVLVTREARQAIPPVAPTSKSGGVGGAIGGYYINGTTPSGNLPLPGGPSPTR